MKVQGTPITITKNNKPVAVVVSMEEYEMIEKMKLRVLQVDIAEAQQQVRAGQVADGELVFAKLKEGKYD